MRRISFWFLSTLSVVVLLFGYDASTTGHASTSASPPAIVSSQTGSAQSGSSRSSASGTSGSAGSSSGASPSGSSSSAKAATTKTVRKPVRKPVSTKTVTGELAQTQWGPVQVRLTVKGRAITGVDVLRYPSGNPRDDQINSYALPILIQETTRRQSASIDMVSGATVTSTGYLQSLQSALDRASL